MLALLLNCPPHGSKIAASTPGISHRQHCGDIQRQKTVGAACHLKVSPRATTSLPSDNLPFLLGDQKSIDDHAQTNYWPEQQKLLLYFDQWQFMDGVRDGSSVPKA